MLVQAAGVPGIGMPIKLSRTPRRVQSAAPRVGQHTRELLIEHGYDAAAIDALIAQETIVEHAAA
jgi:formyl-CoA transferase